MQSMTPLIGTQSLDTDNREDWLSPSGWKARRRSTFSRALRVRLAFIKARDGFSRYYTAFRLYLVIELTKVDHVTRTSLGCNILRILLYTKFIVRTAA